MSLYYDIFNGDADGICSLHQLRLAESRQATLVTGVKRDIRLLDQVAQVRGAELTVLDISLDSNRTALLQLLEYCRVFYVDHHYAGDLPPSPNLVAHLDPSPEICTALMVDVLLSGRFRAWAVAAAFGDNLHASARKAAATLQLTEAQVERLQELGELMNYNSYGRQIADLHIPPQMLYEAVKPYADPLVFCEEAEFLALLRQGFADDLRRARMITALRETAHGRVFAFPAEKWANRIAGVFSNEKARERPDAAHALLVDNDDGSFMVSVRAPLVRRQGADSLCCAFATGGGRAAAAGINALPAGQIEDFCQKFNEVFSP
ncbi:MAG TPA: acetyltransferase [Desulfobulbaceae bacterium]|nr:MAG: acetyltransferase [Deltaproteobacteria bacterium RIFOXYD12_FULL_53_23]HCC54907.1 acetyltransferase [Desulfobulbaceae bacterium]